MRLELGQVEAIFRYPVKSMGDERLEVANLGWHGLDGDRRLAFRRIDDRGGIPWLTAGKLPDLLRFAPRRRDEDGTQGDLPTHIRTPDGKDLLVLGRQQSQSRADCTQPCASYRASALAVTQLGVPRGAAPAA